MCGPVVYAASKLKIPTIIHEQNSLPGITNKFLARYVNKVGICFEEAKEHFPSEKVVLRETQEPLKSSLLKRENLLKSLGWMRRKKRFLFLAGAEVQLNQSSSD